QYYPVSEHVKPATNHTFARCCEEWMECRKKEKGTKTGGPEATNTKDYNRIRDIYSKNVFKGPVGQAAFYQILRDRCERLGIDFTSRCPTGTRTPKSSPALQATTSKSKANRGPRRQHDSESIVVSSEAEDDAEEEKKQ